MQNVLFYVLEAEMFVQNVRFKMFHHGYKRMDQDLNPGDLYDVENKIKIHTKHPLGLLTYIDTSYHV
jgi:hypothetical protein